MKKARLFFIASTAIMVMLTFCVFLYVWFSHMPLSLANAPTSAVSQTGKLNINTATVSELESLPGIGPNLAQAIIDYRSKNGAFQNIGELTSVSGIGAAKLEKIADLITVGG